MERKFDFPILRKVKLMTYEEIHPIFHIKKFEEIRNEFLIKKIDIFFLKKEAKINTRINIFISLTIKKLFRPISKNQESILEPNTANGAKYNIGLKIKSSFSLTKLRIL